MSWFKKRRVYYNLTQFYSVRKRLVYFRSTDVEQGNWDRLLWSVPDEMLFLIARGYEIIIYDKTSNGKGKIEKIFVPVLEDLLNYIYFGFAPKYKRLRSSFVKALKVLNDNSKLFTKFMFWKDRFPEKDYDKRPVKIVGISKKVKKEVKTLLKSNEKGF